MSNTYNCETNFNEIGSDSVEECCVDYPTYCNNNSLNESKLNCEKNIIYTEYKTFESNKWFLSGWTQVNDDCWLDSEVYAMFSNPSLNKYFYKILNSFNESSIQNEKDIALHIRNYLYGIDDLNWSSKSSVCKQYFKNKITNSLIEWTKANKYSLDIGSDDETVSTSFDKDKDNNICNGPLYILYKLFSLKNTSFIDYIQPSQDDMNYFCNGKTTTPMVFLIEKILKDKTLPMIFLSLTTYNTSICNDKSLLRNIINIHNYSLQSIVFGIGIHITALTLYQNQVVLYDNQDEIPTSILEDPSIHLFKNSQQIMFTYLKKNTVTGGYFKKSKKKNKSKKSKKKNKSKKSKK